jgi:hypothetical protein
MPAKRCPNAASYKMRGMGSGVISLPRKPLALIFEGSSSAMCQEKIIAQSGWSEYSFVSSTTGISVPGIYLPIFSEPEISQTYSINPSSRPT